MNQTQRSTTVTAGPSLAAYQGTTLISPSVYISFATVYAKNDCNSTTGQPQMGSILALDPSDLSSALGNYHARSTDMSDLAEGKTAVSMYAEPFTLADLNWPYPLWVWDEQQRCKSYIDNDVCSVIVSGKYNPVLAVPMQIRSMDAAWATCALDVEGLYDPPKALQPAEAVTTPTVPAGGATSNPPAAAASTPASPTPAPTSDTIAGPTTAPAASSSQSADDPVEATPSVQPDQVASSTQGNPQQSTDGGQTTGGGTPADPSTSGDQVVSSMRGDPQQSTNGGQATGGGTVADPGTSGDPTSAATAPSSGAGGSGGRNAGPGQDSEASSNGDPGITAPIATIGSGANAVTIVPDALDSAQVMAQSDRGTTTLQAGSAGTINGRAASGNNTGNVVLASSTVVGLGSDPGSGNAAVATVGSCTVAQDPSGQGVVINRASTLQPGQATVLSDQGGTVTISANTNGGVAVASQGSTTVLQAGLSSGSLSGFVVAGETLTAGGSAAVIAGTNTRLCHLVAAFFRSRAAQQAPLLQTEAVHSP